MAATTRVSSTQLDMLLDFLREHKSLATGVRLSSPFKEKSDKKWEELALALNSVGHGSFKTGHGWKRYWMGFKHQCRERAKAKALEESGDHKYANNRIILTETDRKALSIIGDENVFGDIDPLSVCCNGSVPDTGKRHIVVIPHLVPSLAIEPAASTTVNQKENLDVVEDPIKSSDDEEHEKDSEENPTNADNTAPLSFASRTANIRSRSTSKSPVTPRQRQKRERSNRSISSNSCNNEPLGNERLDTAFIAEMERRRVEAEEKLATAAMMNAKAALIQADTAKMLAKAHLELVELLKNAINK